MAGKTRYDVARGLFGDVRAKTSTAGAQAQKAAVRMATALSDSTGSAGSYAVEVRLDSSDESTSVTLASDAPVKAGDRVAVVSSGSTYKAVSAAESSRTAERISAQVGEFGTLIAGKASIEDLNAVSASVKALDADVANVADLVATKASVSDLEAAQADIASLQADTASISELVAGKADVGDLEAATADIADLKADKASVSDLEAVSAKVANLGATYATIDFANISEAAVEKVFADSGIIRDLVVSEGKITGELVGVTIKGDLIEGGTVVADKLVVKGEDGLFYKLNTDGVSTTAEQTEYNSLNGSVITAKSVTAEKVAVDDLVAFGATIGGYHITQESLYSGAKASATNTTRGVYMGADGQMALGDSSNYLRYYLGDDGTYLLELSMNGSNVATTGDLDEVSGAVEELKPAVSETSSKLQALSDSISTLVTDSAGNSLMQQTADGWTFSTAALESAIDGVQGALGDDIAATNAAVDNLTKAVSTLQEGSKYMTYSDGVLTLGTVGGSFNLQITESKISFVASGQEVAYISNQQLYITSAIITDELTIGAGGKGYVWKYRANGHLGLRYVG